MRAVAALAGVLAAALLVGEMTMRPSASDRALLLAVFGGVTVLAGVLVGLARRTTMRSLRTGVLAASLTAVTVAAAAVLAAAGTMFLSPHDLRLVLVALGLGVGSGSILAVTLVHPLLRDLATVGRTAAAIADGDHQARTGVDRPDELGQVAATVDDLASRLAEAEHRRMRVEAARRDLFAAIGHDLRSPLTALSTGLEALEDGMAADPARTIRALRRETALLGTLVDDVFLLARIESDALELTIERLDLTELADEAIEALAPVAATRDVTLTLVADRAVAVRGSARELGRVLRNLLDNAVRHAPAATTVTVSVRLTDEGAAVEVRDQGPGFPPQLLDEAFATFTRGDAARVRDGAGAGLGLAIARGLVGAHGGTIAAAPGPGGCVRIMLPFARAAAAREPDASGVGSTAAGAIRSAGSGPGQVSPRVE